MDAKAVTFGIPAFNSAVHLAVTLDSLLAQTYPNVQIIISDNASTDDTEMIGREYAQKHDNITYIRQPKNIGSAGNFPFLQKQAKTPYFAWAGSHDYWDPEFTSRLVAILDANPSVVLAYPRTRYIDLNGDFLSIDDYSLDTTGLTRIGSYRKILWQLYNCYLIHGIMRNDVLPTLRFPPVISGDHVTIAEIGLYGEIAFLDEVLFSARVMRPQERMGSDQYYRRVMNLMTGEDVEVIQESDKLRLKRDLREAHLELLAKSKLSVTEKLVARWQTYYCFNTRWQVRVGPLHAFHRVIKRLVPEPVRLRITGWLFR